MLNINQLRIKEFCNERFIKIKKKSYMHKEVLFIADADGHYGYEQKGLLSALMLDDARKVFDAGLDSYHIKSQLKVVISCTLFLSYQPEQHISQ